MNRSLVAAAAAFATLATFGATSHAATTAVQTKGLDLTTAEGQAKLDSRIHRAVRDVCSEAVTGSLIVFTDKGCMIKARAAVEKQVASRLSDTRLGG